MGVDFAMLGDVGFVHEHERDGVRLYRSWRGDLSDLEGKQELGLKWFWSCNYW